MKKKKKNLRSRPNVTARKPVRKRASPKKRRYLIWACFAFTFFIFLGIITFFWIDRKVAAALNKGTKPEFGIYSAPLNIAAFHKNIESLSLPKKTGLLNNELLRRRYVEVGGTPQRIKEFSQSNGAYQIVTALDSEPIQFDLTKPNTLEAELPPEPLSNNDGSDVRASRFVPLKDLPEHTKKAVMAIEDERFYSHFGLDIVGILRAIFTNITHGGLVQGGSTLTQQLAKNLILSPERSLKRKLLEFMAALSLEMRLSKDEILELYLNEVYLGQEGSVAIHGFPEAAQTYFGKKIQDTTPSESALLAGTIKAPSYYSPRRHADRAKERQEIVLLKMKELGFLAEKDLKTATIQAPKIKDPVLHKKTAPYFVQAISQALVNSYSLSPDEVEALNIETGLDLGMQECAERAVQKGLQKVEGAFPKLRRSKKELEVGLVALEPYSGLVKAWVGGRSFSKNQFDHVSQGSRQIGSTVKPFLYLTALDKDMNSYKVATTISVLEDVPITLDIGHHQSWEPENYDKDFRGDVTLRYALENSLNLPAVYVAQKVGIEAIRETLLRYKISDAIEAVPSLALGAVDTTLLRLTSAYAALANGGLYVEPRMFISVKDSTGFTKASQPLSETKISDEDPAYVLTDMLRGVIERGTAKGVRGFGYTRDAAGKTGTSDSTRDAWFVGFTPSLSTGVWVGYDDNKKLGLTGGQLAVPIWSEFMKCAEPFYSNSPFLQPPGVIIADVNAETGTLVTEDCPDYTKIREVFVAGTEPTESCGDLGRSAERQGKDEESEYMEEESSE